MRELLAYLPVPHADAENEHDAAFYSDLREAMFSLGVSPGHGTSIARQVQETKKALSSASAEEIAQYVEQQRVTFQKMAGAGYEARVAKIWDFLLEAGPRSPELRRLIREQPDGFSHWTVVDKLAQVADYQRRMGRRT